MALEHRHTSYGMTLIHKVGNYHQIEANTKVARCNNSGRNLRGLNFHFPKPNVTEILKQGTEMMKKYLALHCSISLAPFEGLYCHVSSESKVAI